MQAVTILPPSATWYTSAAACTQGELFAYGAYNYVVLVDQASGVVRGALYGHHNKVTSLSSTAVQDVIVSGGKDRTVIVWSVADCSIVKRRGKLEAGVVALCAGFSGSSQVLVALENGALGLWDWRKGGGLQKGPQLERPAARVASVGCSPAARGAGRAADQAVVLSDRGVVVGLQLPAMEVLWRVDVTALATNRGVRADGYQVKSKLVLAHDCALTLVPIPQADTQSAGDPSSAASKPDGPAPCTHVLLMAVGTRLGVVHLFGWPVQQPELAQLPGAAETPNRAGESCTEACSAESAAAERSVLEASARVTEASVAADCGDPAAATGEMAATDQALSEVRNADACDACSAPTIEASESREADQVPSGRKPTGGELSKLQSADKDAGGGLPGERRGMEECASADEGSSDGGGLIDRPPVFLQTATLPRAGGGAHVRSARTDATQAWVPVCWLPQELPPPTTDAAAAHVSATLLSAASTGAPVVLRLRSAAATLQNLLLSQTQPPVAPSGTHGPSPRMRPPSSFSGPGRVEPSLSRSQPRSTADTTPGSASAATWRSDLPTAPWAIDCCLVRADDAHTHSRMAFSVLTALLDPPQYGVSPAGEPQVLAGGAAAHDAPTTGSSAGPTHPRHLSAAAIDVASRGAEEREAAAASVEGLGNTEQDPEVCKSDGSPVCGEAGALASMEQVDAAAAATGPWAAGTSGQVQDPASRPCVGLRLRVFSTSLDRRTIVWGLKAGATGDSALLEDMVMVRRKWAPVACHPGTGAEILAACVVQQGANATVFASTGDRIIHCLTCSPPGRNAHEAILSVSSSTLFNQSLSNSSATALAAVGPLLFVGCEDGTMGVLNASLTPSKAVFSAFHHRHSGRVHAVHVVSKRLLEHTHAFGRKHADDSECSGSAALGSTGVGGHGDGSGDDATRGGEAVAELPRERDAAEVPACGAADPGGNAAHVQASDSNAGGGGSLELRGSASLKVSESCGAKGAGGKGSRTSAGRHEEDLAVELLTLSSEGEVLAWRGLPFATELARSCASGADARKSLQGVTATVVASAGTSCFAFDPQRALLCTGSSDGHVTLTEYPDLGEHSLDPLVPPPQPRTLVMGHLHSAAVSAVAVLPDVCAGARLQRAVGPEHAQTPRLSEGPRDGGVGAPEAPDVRDHGTVHVVSGCNNGTVLVSRAARPGPQGAGGGSPLLTVLVVLREAGRPVLSLLCEPTVLVPPPHLLDQGAEGGGAMQQHNAPVAKSGSMHVGSRAEADASCGEEDQHVDGSCNGGVGEVPVPGTGNGGGAGDAGMVGGSNRLGLQVCAVAPNGPAHRWFIPAPWLGQQTGYAPSGDDAEGHTWGSGAVMPPGEPLGPARGGLHAAYAWGPMEGAQRASAPVLFAHPHGACSRLSAETRRPPCAVQMQLSEAPLEDGDELRRGPGGGSCSVHGRSTALQQSWVFAPCADHAMRCWTLSSPPPPPPRHPTQPEAAALELSSSVGTSRCAATPQPPAAPDVAAPAHAAAPEGGEGRDVSTGKAAAEGPSAPAAACSVADTAPLADQQPVVPASAPSSVQQDAAGGEGPCESLTADSATPAANLGRAPPDEHVAAPTDALAPRTPATTAAGQRDRGSFGARVAAAGRTFAGATAAKHRPRPTQLGSTSTLGGYIDAAQSGTASASPASCLPGACSTPVDADVCIQRIIDAGAVPAALSGGKDAGAAQTRVAAVRAAHAEALPHLWQGDIVSALRIVIEASALNADFVAMAAGAGAPVWHAVVRAHAAALEAAEDTHLAAVYLCSAGDFEDAVAVYARRGLLLEALLLAERHLTPDAATTRSLRQRLCLRITHAHAGLQAHECARWGAEVAALAGSKARAVALLVQQGTPSELLAAAELLADVDSSARGKACAVRLAARAVLCAGNAEDVRPRADARQLWGQDDTMRVTVGCVGALVTLLQAWLLAMVTEAGSLGKGLGSLDHVNLAAAKAASFGLQLLVPGIANATGVGVQSQEGGSGAGGASCSNVFAGMCVQLAAHWQAHLELLAHLPEAHWLDGSLDASVESTVAHNAECALPGAQALATCAGSVMDSWAAVAAQLPSADVFELPGLPSQTPKAAARECQAGDGRDGSAAAHNPAQRLLACCDALAVDAVELPGTREEGLPERDELPPLDAQCKCALAIFKHWLQMKGAAACTAPGTDATPDPQSVSAAWTSHLEATCIAWVEASGRLGSASARGTCSKQLLARLGVEAAWAEHLAVGAKPPSAAAAPEVPEGESDSIPIRHHPAPSKSTSFDPSHWWWWVPAADACDFELPGSGDHPLSDDAPESAKPEMCDAAGHDTAISPGAEAGPVREGVTAGVQVVDSRRGSKKQHKGKPPHPDRSGAEITGLHWEDVEAFQEEGLAMLPADWARLRARYTHADVVHQPDLHPEAVRGLSNKAGGEARDDAVLVEPILAADTEVEQDAETLASPYSASLAVLGGNAGAFEHTCQADVVLDGWRQALWSHAQFGL